jgi:hypothetical protein
LACGRAGRQAFSRTIGLVAALTKKALDETSVKDILSRLQHEILSGLYDKASALNKDFSDLWRPGS